MNRYPDARVIRPRLDAAEIKARLTERMPELAATLLGKPSSTSRREWRWGGKGSFSVDVAGPKAGVWHSFETGDKGDAISLIEFARDLDFRSALAWAADWLGGMAASPPPMKATSPARPDEGDEEEAKLVKRALQIFDEAVPLPGTLAERYLRDIRGVTDFDRDGRVLRFHQRIYFKPKGGPAIYVPAMIALWRDIHDDTRCGIHRTFLDEAGNKLDKQSLGRLKNAAIKLDSDEAVSLGLAISEGIEKAEAVRTFGIRPVWTLNGAGAIGAFPILPGFSLTIYSDHDPEGTGLAQAEKCRARWIAAGEEPPRIIMPAERGKDFDELLRRAA